MSARNTSSSGMWRLAGATTCSARLASAAPRAASAASAATHCPSARATYSASGVVTGCRRSLVGKSV
eukprot:44857-Chlamydomonas_euryale.AAC.1